MNRQDVKKITIKSAAETQSNEYKIEPTRKSIRQRKVTLAPLIGVHLRSSASNLEMKPVVQLERTGCGIAAVAAIASVSYPKAKSVANSLGIRAEDQALWSATSHVRKLLRRFGRKAGSREIPFRSWNALPDLALLSIKWHRERGKPYWHWVVFVREGDEAYVLDSKKALRTHRRTDFGRIKPKWFIPVAQRRKG